MSDQSNTTSEKIPLKSIWWLMLYASDMYEKMRDDKSAKVNYEQNPDEVLDIIAAILTTEVKRRIRYMLSHELQRKQADLTRIRGRINHIRTERQRLRQQGKIACSFDEFTVDTPKNRLVVAALNQLSTRVDDKTLGQRCRTYASMFTRYGISNRFDQRRDMPSIKNANHDKNDVFMIAAAQLALNIIRIPNEESGSLDMVSLKKNELFALFEKAMANFYEINFGNGWYVKSQKPLSWPAVKENDLLPKMRADIILEKKDKSHQIIIDTKYTEIITKRTIEKHEYEKFKSSHIFQIYAYLRSQEREDDKLSTTSDGILLYPSTGTDYDESATIQGHKIRFVTVNLNVNFKTMQERLLNLIPV